MKGSMRFVLGCLIFGVSGACLLLAHEDDPEKKGAEKKGEGKNTRGNSSFSEALFKRLDANQDGKISPDEFKRLTDLRERMAQKGESPEAKAKLTEKLKEKGIDPESIKQKLQDKGIDPESIKEKLKERKATQGAMKPGELFKKLDKNQDNYLDPDEFRALGGQADRAPKK